MALRASMNPSRGRQLPGSCQDLESGKETSVHGYEGREAAAAHLLACPEGPKVCAAALTGVRAET